MSISSVCSLSGLVYVTYYMDNNVTNPYQLWQTMGSPDYPTAEQFRHLRSVEVILDILEYVAFFFACIDIVN